MEGVYKAQLSEDILRIFWGFKSIRGRAVIRLIDAYSVEQR